MQRAWNSQNNFEKGKQVWRTIVCYWCKERNMDNGTE